MISPCQKLKP